MKKLNNFIAYSVFLLISFFCRLKKTTINPSGILFVNLGKIGDAIISSFVFSNEKELNKFGKIGFVMEKSVEKLFENYNGSIRLFFVDKKKYKWNIFYRLSILCELRQFNFAKVYNLSFTRISIDDEIALIASLNGNSYAFENNTILTRIFGWKFDKHYTEIFERNKSLSDFENQRRILFGMGLETVSSKRKIFCRKGKVDGIPDKYFVIAPFASKRVKEWGIDNYVKLIEKLTKGLNTKAVILHSEKTKFFSRSNKNIIDLCGKTSLCESSEVIKNAEFFIGNDSGLLHIAKAHNVKVFGIVGGGVWGRIYPYNSDDHATYFFHKTDCFGCDWVCKYEVPVCLSEVKVEDVWRKIENEVNG